MSFPRPGPCPECGVFCSRRLPHDCSPPVRVRDEIPFSGVSPLIAWPESARVKRSDGSVVLRSPLPIVGPRLLVQLARHRSHARRDLPSGKRARYGPAHALADLVSSPDEVLDAVLRPGPAWVPCSGTWHRVLLWDGDLCLMNHSQVDLESERVAAAISGIPLGGCVDALDRWSSRRTAVRLPWLETLATLDAAASFGVDELQRWDAWIDARVDVDLVQQAAAAGVDDEELLRWVDWERSIPEIAAWRAAGWTAAEAKLLADDPVFRETRAREWRAAGLEVGIITAAATWDFTLHDTLDWWDAGFQPHVAHILLANGVDVAEARRRKQKLKRIDLVLKPFLTRVY